MRICYSIVGEHGPDGEQVWIVQGSHRCFVLVHESLLADPHMMMRLISLRVTQHVQREWLHVGAVVDVA